MNLTPLSTIETERGRAALALFLETSPFVRHLDEVSAFDLDATDFEFQAVDGTMSVSGRSIGGSEFTATALSPEDKANGQLALHGGALKLDRTYVRDANNGLMDINTWLDKKLTRMIKGWAKGMESTMFNGTNAETPKLMKGLSNIINGDDDIPNFTGEKGVLNPLDYISSVDHLDLTDKDNWPLFHRLMEIFIASVENPTGIHLNKEAAALITLIAKEFNAYGESRDLTGVPVGTWNRVPIIKLLDNTITNTEPNANATPANVCTSIWCSSFSETTVSVVTNSGLYWKEPEEAQQSNLAAQEYIWEFGAAWRFEEKNSLRRMMKLKVK